MVFFFLAGTEGTLGVGRVIVPGKLELPTTLDELAVEGALGKLDALESERYKGDSSYHPEQISG